MNRTHIYLVLLIFPLFVHAQRTGIMTSKYGGIDGVITTNSTIIINERGGYDGTPFLNEDFKKGKIVFESDTIKNVSIRYNVAYESMQLRVDDEGKATVFSDEDAVVYIDGLEYKFYDYKRNGKSVGGYFQVIYEEDGNPQKAKLLKKNFKKLIDGGKMKLGDLTKPKDELKDVSDYYILLQGFPKLVDKRKSKFLSIFDEQYRKKMDQYIDENRLKPRKEDDLVLIVKYYNKISA